MSNSARPEVSVETLPSLVRDDAVELLRHNHDVDWDEFDSQAYWKHNYETLRNDDQSIIQTVAGFFSRHFRETPGTELLRGLDVGSGANLYPALALLPWSGSITLTDPAAPNLDWLRRAAAGIGVENARGDWVWQPFWAEFARFPGYQQLANPRQLLAARHELRRSGVLDLDRAGWDLGTMFFVAESTTSYPEEFRAAAAGFLAALVPGAPFAAGFMVGSIGYQVAGRSYPAVRAVNAEMIESVLGRLCAELTVITVDVPAQNPEQDGYDGMVVALGVTAEAGPVISLPAGPDRS